VSPTADEGALASLAAVRALILVLSSATLLACASAEGAAVQTPETAPGEAVFLVSGRGWGHGVGMSQYGAYGMANEGASYAKILAYFYSGTQLGKTSTDEVRVLLAEGRRLVSISSTLPFTAVDASGQVTKLPAGPVVVKPNLVLPGADGAKPKRALPPVVFRSGKAPLALDGRPYRGRLEVAVQGAYVRVVNSVQIESYLQGVVAGEMPHTWPLEALKAQAVAARSYALANLVKGKPFDLYPDQRSQVYLGIAGEKERASEAVRATARQVVLYGGRVASTLYFSSSGGKTASAADVFGTPIPYLVSRPDPWDRLSPYHSWGPFVLGARTVQAKLELPARVIDATATPTPSGRVRTVTLQTVTGSTSIPAALVRTSLGLRSTWLSLAVLRLDRPRGAVEFRSPLTLTGVARGLPAPTLASSGDGSSWSTVGLLAREANGTVSVVVKPAKTTRYRIESKGGASPALLVRVAPRVRLGVPPALGPDGVLSGTVRPRVSGAPVAIERLKGTIWKQIARTAVDRAGAFQAQIQLVPSSYRARVAATEGLAEGVSPVLTVSG
jgi:stage II sporulation protein D